jgi:hypothetical protein
MSRTRHVTRHGERPHRQSSPTRLTTPSGGGVYYWPYEQRPVNLGTSKQPGGGYAKDRAEHARLKKLGKRRERRKRNRGMGFVR